MKRRWKPSRWIGCLLLCLLLSGCQKQEKSSSPGPDSSLSSETEPTLSTGDTVTTTTGTPTSFTVGFCTADSMHVRAGAGLDYKGIGGLKYQEQVTIVDREGDWYKIVFGDEYGYVSAQYISSTRPPDTTAPETTTTAPDTGTSPTSGTTSAA